MILLGVDDATLVGAPRELLMGKLGDLQLADAVIVDEAGFHYMWPNEPLQIGKTLEMNDRRAVIVGIFRASHTFQTQPIVFTRLARRRCSCRRIAACCRSCWPRPRPAKRREPLPGDPRTDRLRAMTRDEFIWLTMDYYLENTGIPLNFGTTVLLGFIVGCAIAGQTFYLFTVENLRQFGTLKAMGMSDRRDRRDDCGAGPGGRGYRLLHRRRPGHRRGADDPGDPADHVVLPAVAGAGADRRRRAVHRACVEPAEHPASRGPRAGHGVSMMIQAAIETSHTLPRYHQGLRRGRVPHSSSARRDRRYLSRRIDALGGAQRLRQDDADLDPGRNPQPRPRAKSEVLGVRLDRLSKNERSDFRAQNVGFVFQQFNLLPALTAAENAAVPLVIRGFSKAAATSRAAAVLNAVGLGDRLESLPAKLSGGQQQRVAIARAWSTSRACWCAMNRHRPSMPKPGTPS